MIILTKIDGTKITINADEIEFVETSHDSTVTLKSGKRFIVKENAEEITNLVIDYKQKCYAKLLNIETSGTL